MRATLSFTMVLVIQLRCCSLHEPSTPLTLGPNLFDGLAELLRRAGQNLTLGEAGADPGVAVQTAQLGPGRLQATIVVGRTAVQPNNSLRRVQVVGLDNATATLNGSAVAVGQPVSLPAEATQAELIVTRIGPGPFTARQSVKDECGA